jgi:Na+/H+-dicarboxylate symporter
MNNWVKNYSGMIWLITGIVAGSAAGVILGKDAEVLKPLGDIFLNLLFVAVIPLVFFAIASAIANLEGEQKLSRIMTIMSLVFLSTVIISALLTIVAVWLFPVHQLSVLSPEILSQQSGKKLSGDQVTELFTTGEFYQLLSRKNMLAMIIFAILTGFGTLKAGEKGRQEMKCLKMFLFLL